MKKNIQEIIEIPEGFQATLKNGELSIKKGDKEVKKRVVENPKIEIKLDSNKISIICEKSTKNELKIINSIISHIKNMIEGVEKDFVYKLEICFVHFPMTVKVEGDIIKIKNFLGEKVDRTAKILPNVKVTIKGNLIEVVSPDVEAAGQTAARIEIATKIRNRDRRVFQDGIFITEKPGRRQDE